MTIGIIGAMDEEVALVLETMTEKQEKEVANCLFISGKLNGQAIVLLKSGIGKVNAAMATTILHERFTVDCIINTGSAGGFAKELEVGDVVISTQVVHHDVDATAFDYAYGQVPSMPAMYDADAGLVTKTTKVVQQMGIRSKEGIIATGDSFMSDPNRVVFVREKFPTMIAAEMEAAAVAQVCYQYKTPFVIIRALSDIAGKESSISFDAFLETAATNAANLIIKLVREI
ncbi:MULTISPECIES: 5'-methylthioadenosine/S-adenosylhomocysteine nucleosidase [Virgibacillus]|uniref:5'-methylthioadenosine/S-adenosylhomocysteine nucleosidase n=2 Tax=Virgibacillus TaxID=84406 RepID=A0A024QB85_9BACI|nr:MULTISPECIES: 5'-methylthioadenosine/S-adenosylhomocysteine nucleosidase [Virgibacillus]EQB35880.1 hypothetical protein M948_12635 [Virgibacillus sp. CM-4]MYL41682.1 5'-methylthioadenosine/S-adenosylhomocysteine nucleosidase [Virgibacillus massiliensis]GGJ48967.1 5'-methylthioadenosine/S-adenosylhomocysteine nucleosidase [Virgibacillus kapii]CDQ39492.1 5'-methylthioadenosine/S-adenosylhomocysteine nucleosidase [Virgibacillus massiliensis]